MGSGRRNDDSFVAFINTQSGRLVAQAELLCGDREQARDIVQTVLTRAYIHWPRIEHGSPFHYLSRAVANAVTDWWRSAHRRREILTDVLPDIAVISRDESLEDRDVLMAAVAHLTKRERSVLVLRYLADMSEREVAESLKISIGTVKSTCHKALRKLQGSELGRHFGKEPTDAHSG